MRLTEAVREIEALLAAAEGEYEYDGKFQVGINLPDGSWTGFRTPREHAALIVALRNHAPELLAAYKAQRELLKDARTALISLRDLAPQVKCYADEAEKVIARISEVSPLPTFESLKDDAALARGEKEKGESND